MFLKFAFYYFVFQEKNLKHSTGDKSVVQTKTDSKECVNLIVLNQF